MFVANLSLSAVTDGEVLLNLLKQTSRSILDVSCDGAYDTRKCHAVIEIRGYIALIPLQEKVLSSGPWSSSKSYNRPPEAYDSDKY